MAASLFADLPQVPFDDVGKFVLCLILVAYLANQLKKLFGWDTTETDVKRKVEAVAVQVALCATKEEVRSLREEVKESKDRAEDTVRAVNEIKVSLERLRVELIREINESSRREYKR